jgi:hypothetical protein
MARQYISVQFTPGARPYTYHNDGAPVTIGDLVYVGVGGGQKKRVTVADLVTEPAHETRAIMGKVEEAAANG